jgi:non-specific serine/threonine protein kinase
LALRPAGFDSEIVTLVTLMQNLGRMVLGYHHADAMRQVRRLMQPAVGAPGEPELPGMSEQAAGYAVLGASIESMALAVARWMGMGGVDESVLLLMRRLPEDKPVRSVDSDDDVLRALASAANEAVDAMALPPSLQAAALERVAKRYARVLDLNPRDFSAAVLASAGAQSAAASAPLAA